jgi:mono/diheme cytochrome c family protein
MAKHKSTTPPAGTTGHAWDGIEELNTPLPRWWVWLFYATIAWSFGYWVVYPAWPTLSGYTTGLFGYSSRAQLAVDLAELRKIRGEKGAALGETPLTEIEKEPSLLAFAQAQGRAAFANNCVPCHGAGATGAKGYPNLNDDDWLWGGSLVEIRDTIAYGVRSGDPKDHESAMPAFGKTGMLPPTISSSLQTTCARCPAFRCAQALISQRLRRSSPTIAPDATAMMATVTRISAPPISPTRYGFTALTKQRSSRPSPTAARASCRHGQEGSITPPSMHSPCTCTR